MLLSDRRAARANPLDAFGWGARAPALGSAYAAIADDSAAGYYNPAGLARGTDLRIDVGYQAARPLIDVSGQRQALKDARGLAAGIVLPGQILGVRFAFGATLFLPDQYVTRVHVLSYDAPRLQLYDNRTQRFFLGANLSIRLYRGLYIGGGLAFLSRSAGTVELRGQIALVTQEALIFDDTVTHEAWNRSEEPRIVLLFDFVRPGCEGMPQDVPPAEVRAMIRRQAR